MNQAYFVRPFRMGQEPLPIQEPLTPQESNLKRLRDLEAKEPYVVAGVSLVGLGWLLQAISNEKNKPIGFWVEIAGLASLGYAVAGLSRGY